MKDSFRERQARERKNFARRRRSVSGSSCELDRGRGEGEGGDILDYISIGEERKLYLHKVVLRLIFSKRWKESYLL